MQKIFDAQTEERKEVAAVGFADVNPALNYFFFLQLIWERHIQRTVRG